MDELMTDDLKKLLSDITNELHAIAIKDDPETNNKRTKLIGKRELLIDLLAKYDV